MKYASPSAPLGLATLPLALMLVCGLVPLAQAQQAQPGATAVQPQATLAARKRAVTLMNAGKFAEALQGLKAVQADFPADQNIRFLIGQCALETGDAAEAVRQFEAMLASDANLPRVRLELARAYTAQRDFGRAREQFALVMASNPPKVVGDNVEKFLEMIEAQRPWHARLSLAFVSDSNVNTGPGSISVLPGSTSSTITGRADNAWNLVGSLDHVYVLAPDYAWQSEASVNYLDYREEDASDLLMFSISSGLSWKRDKLTLSAPLVFDNIRVGDKAYSWSFGVAPQARYALDEHMQLQGGVSLAHRKHDADYSASSPERDGQSQGIHGGLRIRVGDKAYLQPSLNFARENTRVEHFDNNRWGLDLGYVQTLAAGMTLFVQPAISRTHYGAVDPFYNPSGVPTCEGCGNTRRDMQYQLTANISKSFGKSGLGAALGYTYTRNDSNVSIYDYERQMVTAMLTWIY